MNTGFYKDLDTNFELACKMSEQNFSHEELIALLKNGNIPEKQIAALKLTKLQNINEASILLKNLVGCDGKIREAVANKIKFLLNNNDKYVKFFTMQEFNPFADATIDINGNICRSVIDSVEILKSNETFANKYLTTILSFIDQTFKELDKFIFRDKKYVINKQLFKLYWCLEALKLFANDLPVEKLYKILERASLEKEYTIREKVAQLITLVDNDKFTPIKEKLLKDKNYYVREALK